MSAKILLAQPSEPGTHVAVDKVVFENGVAYYIKEIAMFRAGGAKILSVSNSAWV